jgi:hypothetical protein
MVQNQELWFKPVNDNYPKGDNIMRNLGERSSIYQVLWGLTGDMLEMTIIFIKFT